MTRRASWAALSVAVVAAGGLFMFSPRLGGLALIVLALGIVAFSAFRFL